MPSYRAQPKTHRHAERGSDFYATPAAAVRALLSVYRPPPLVWEPACGDGAIVNVLRAAGHTVIASDLHDWGCPDSISGIDFLMEQQAPPGCDCMITNAPYKQAQEFGEHALYLVPRVVMLCRLCFLESARRTWLLEKAGLQRILVFRNRLPMMHRYSWNGPKNSSSTAFAWFCWERGFNGSPEIGRITCELPPKPARKSGARPGVRIPAATTA